MFWPDVSSSAAPLAMVCMANVAMKAGVRNLVTIKPLSALQATATATDNGAGLIVGDATGWINYGTGEMEFKPTLLPVSGSDYTINHDKYAPQVYTGSGATFNLPNAPIKPGSLSMSVPLTIGGWTHTYKLRDNGSGAMSADGFTATLSQARASLKDANSSGSESSKGGTKGTGYNNDSSVSDDFALNKSESTVMVSAGGISATVDYVTGAVVFDLTTATGKKDTISSKAISSEATVTKTNITGWKY